MPSSYLGKIGKWIQGKIYLYNVTFGLYMLEWWERYLFNVIMIVLFFVVSRFTIETSKRLICYVSGGAWEDYCVFPAKDFHHFSKDRDFVNQLLSPQPL